MEIRASSYVMGDRAGADCDRIWNLGSTMIKVKEHG